MTRVADVLPWAETPERQNPFVFVVGCPRSGTTLLQRMLDNHPELAVAHDSHFIPLAIKNESVGVDPQLTPELVTWVTTYRRFHRLQLSEGDVAEAASRSATYSEFVGALYAAYARAHGKRLAGEKTPDYVRYLPQLHALFPTARFIHIIRDGRDVALSVRDWTQGGKGPSRRAMWDEEPVAVCALWWRRFVSTGFRDGAPLGCSAYREVLYERLVEAPEATLTRAGRVPLPSRFAGDGGVSRGQDPPTIRPFLEERLAASHVRSPRLAFGDGAERPSPVRASRRRRALSARI